MPPAIQQRITVSAVAVGLGAATTGNDAVPSAAALPFKKSRRFILISILMDELKFRQHHDDPQQVGGAFRSGLIAHHVAGNAALGWGGFAA